jgi:cytoskeletal protein CcmA (bactofilin family)
MIGASISIKGELTGEEDLVIQGRFEGRVDLRQNNVTVGKSGHVKADIHGKIISVEGEVEGNLFGEEQIVIRRSGSVWGNITAARVSLEDGSKFKGSIDMDPKGADKSRAANTPAPVKPLGENRESAGNPGQKAASPYKVDPGTQKA